MAENWRRRSVAHQFLVSSLALVLLIFLIGGLALTFLEVARWKTKSMAEIYWPRSVEAQRLAVDASHLIALAAELPAASSFAERQTVTRRIDGLRDAIAGDIERLRAAGVSSADLAGIIQAKRDLLDGADAMTGIVQVGVKLRDQLTHRTEIARAKCEGKAISEECRAVLMALTAPASETAPSQALPGLALVQVLQNDLALNEQRRVNLLRRQSEIAGRFLTLASALSDDAAEQIRQQQNWIYDWATDIEWLLGLTLPLALLGLRFAFREVGKRSTGMEQPL